MERRDQHPCLTRNPFRTLGLWVTATPREISAAGSRMAALARVGRTEPLASDLSWAFGPVVRTPETIEEALRTLRRPEGRLAAGLFWFTCRDEVDSQALEWLCCNPPTRWALDKDVVGAWINREDVCSRVNCANIVLLRQQGDQLAFYMVSSAIKKSVTQLCRWYNGGILVEAEDIRRVYCRALTDGDPKEARRLYDLLNQPDGWGMSDIQSWLDILADIAQQPFTADIEAQLAAAARVDPKDYQEQLRTALRLRTAAMRALPELRRLWGDDSIRYQQLCNRIAHRINYNQVEYAEKAPSQAYDKEYSILLTTYALSLAYDLADRDCYERNLNIYRRRR